MWKEALGTLKQPKLVNKPRGYAHNEVWYWLYLVLLICIKIYHVNFIFVVIIPFFCFILSEIILSVRSFQSFFTSWLQICMFFWNRNIRSLKSCTVQEKNVERCDKGQYHLLITSYVLWRGYPSISASAAAVIHMLSHSKPASTRNFIFSSSYNWIYCMS